MRIEALSILVAVGCLITLLFSRHVAANNLTFNYSRKPRNNHVGKRFSHWKMALKESSAIKRLTYAELQQLIKAEEGEEGRPVECCPTIVEMVEPVGGRNRDDMYVELYRDGDNAQRFFEYSCRPDLLDKPCRFVDRRLQAQSRCVQLFSYTYAIVKNDKHLRHGGQQLGAFQNGTSPWALDYIKVRSGCGCHINSKRVLKMRLKSGEPGPHWHSHRTAAAADATTNSSAEV